MKYIHDFGLLFVLMLVLAACTPMQVSPETSSKTVSSSQQTGLSSDTVFAECEDKSESAKMMHVYSVREECLIEKAKSVEQCKSYKGKQIYRYGSFKNNFEQNQVDKCVQTIAVKNNDVRLCDESGSLRADCYLTVAVNTKNVHLCDISPIPNDCTEKYVYTFLPVGYDFQSEECNKKANGYAVGVLACSLSNLPLEKEFIINNICSFFSPIAAFADKKLELCAAALGGYSRDPTYCDKAGNYKPDCYIVLARTNPQFSLSDCDKAGTDYSGCYSAIAVRDSDVSVCSQLPEASKLDCTGQVAIKTKKLSSCIQLGVSSNQGIQCAQKIISQIKEDEYTYQFCEDLSEFGTGTGVRPDHCFYVVGLKTLNLQACERIVSDETEKSECQARVEHVLKNK